MSSVKPFSEQPDRVAAVPVTRCVEHQLEKAGAAGVFVVDLDEMAELGGGVVHSERRVRHLCEHCLRPAVLDQPELRRGDVIDEEREVVNPCSGPDAVVVSVVLAEKLHLHVAPLAQGCREIPSGWLASHPTLVQLDVVTDEERPHATGGPPFDRTVNVFNRIRDLHRPPQFLPDPVRHGLLSRPEAARSQLRAIVRSVGEPRPARQASRYCCPMVEIDGTRLVASLRRLRTFGATGTGVVRQMFSPVDMESRHWLAEQMTDAGLDAHIDGVGSVFGRSRNPGPALIIGSHSDTQPEGGWLDGAMGVMYGIEVARALRDDPATSHLAVDVASWADEEGAYTSFLGSRSFVGEFPDSALTDARDDGETVRQAIERVGLATVARAALEPARHVGYLEAHIEQGPHLEDTGKRVGVVTAIVGVRAMQITFLGEQNHAGSTPMPRRKDAGVALFDFGVRIRERLMELAGPSTVWTIGDGRLLPGTESIIPGKAWCGLQFRDPSDDIMDTFQAAITDLATEMTAEGPVAVSAELRRAPTPPAVMDRDVRGRLCEAAEARVPSAWVEMPSAAMHDANVLSEHVPSGMLFIPSIRGVSHDFAEDSTELDIITGCQVLADAATAILT